MLERLSQLTRLHLGGCVAYLTTATVEAILQMLPSLQYLALCPDAEDEALDGFPASIATSCSQLRHLEISGACLGDIPPELGDLSGLTRLQLERLKVTALPDSISRLTCLRELLLTHNPYLQLLLPGLTACQQLTLLQVSYYISSTLFPGLASLQCLSGCIDVEEHGPDLTKLRALTELQLHIEDFQSVPAALGSMTTLRTLGIDRASLYDLPAGPYLCHLESLSITDCIFHAGVPASLIAATNLRHLECSASYNATISPGIGLTAADINVLSSLPALAILELTHRRIMEQEDWDERVVQLRAACVAQGRAPPNTVSDPIRVPWDYEAYMDYED